MADASVVEIAGNSKDENGNGEQKPVPYRKRGMISYQTWDHSLRAGAFAFTLAAAVIMGTNKETKYFPVGVINNVPVTIPITAKYHYTPSYVSFVVINAVAGGYALLTLLTSMVTQKIYKSPRSNFHNFFLSLTDLVIVAALTAGASAAAAVSDIGREGNSHSRWNKICDNYSKFCIHGGIALLVSFAGVGMFLLLNLSSTYSAYKRSLRAGSN
eukprot:PITA_27398